MNRRQRIDAHLDRIGLRITKVRVRRAKPIGRMPDDILNRFQTRIALLKRKLTELEKMGGYSDQMSQELRHLLADEIQEIHVRSERLARALLGESGDLRKIHRPLCHVEIPLRKEEETNDDSPEPSARADV